MLKKRTGNGEGAKLDKNEIRWRVIKRTENTLEMYKNSESAAKHIHGKQNKQWILM